MDRSNIDYVSKLSTADDNAMVRLKQEEMLLASARQEVLSTLNSYSERDNIVCDSDSNEQSVKEKLLFAAARTGDLNTILVLLSEYERGEIELDINTKGQEKSNHGWTALHLASYFGHTKIAELLLKQGASVNVINETGDTPLHKASYTGREDLVLLLLLNKADVFIKNGEGFTPRDICKNAVIAEQLEAAEKTDLRKKSDLLLQASREGDTHVIEDLLRNDEPIDINCQDSIGNTALHCAAYRGQKAVAVLLLQNGIDPNLKNVRGQLAIDLAINEPMKQILEMQSVKKLQKTATRFEGPLLRKSRFFGWKEMWTILEKGIMSFFISRADASTGTRRKGYKYLDGAEISILDQDVGAFMIKFPNKTCQRFSVPKVTYRQFDRQKWINAISKHIEFSTQYVKENMMNVDTDDDSDCIPLGTMQDKLQTAQAHQQLLEKQIGNLKPVLNSLVQQELRSNNVNNSQFYTSSSQFHESSSQLQESSWQHLPNELDKLVELVHKASSSLDHCLTVFSQQEEMRMLQYKQQQQQIRVLQDALHALAQEHHELEQSFISPNRSPIYSPISDDCDEFYDAFEATDEIQPDSVRQNEIFSQSTDTNTLENERAFFSSFSSASISLSDHIQNRQDSKWGRAALPVPQYSRNDFSVWSILKQCIGKELSKITMPIIFNEPLSFLQRLSENMEYCNLLVQANNFDNPVKRLEYVTAFAMASISSNIDRLGKPFNPLLGETYELMRDDLDFRIVSEQVSHHPPISAFHADSQQFIFCGAIYPKLKLWARSVEIKPEGTLTVKLLKHNEIYTWSGINCCVHNIIVGKLWMEQCGTMEIKCHTTGLSASLTFKPSGWYGKDLHCVEGFIYDETKTKLRFLYGKWCSYLKSADIIHYDDYSMADKLSKSKTKVSNQDPNSKNLKNSKLYVSLGIVEDVNSNSDYFRDIPSDLLWEADLKPSYSSEYYNFTLFAMALNELKKGTENCLPSTDCRLRPDIRKLEEGELDSASDEKHRLEEKQREARKIRKKENSEWVPRWFEYSSHEYTKENTWYYKGGYWERNYKNCADIF